MGSKEARGRVAGIVGVAKHHPRLVPRGGVSGLEYHDGGAGADAKLR
jgi:hypothetical protein